MGAARRIHEVCLQVKQRLKERDRKHRVQQQVAVVEPPPVAAPTGALAALSNLGSSIRGGIMSAFSSNKNTATALAPLPEQEQAKPKQVVPSTEPEEPAAPTKGELRRAWDLEVIQKKKAAKEAARNPVKPKLANKDHSEDLQKKIDAIRR